MVQQHDNSKKHSSNSTAKSGQATKTLPKQQQETLALAEHEALAKITLNKDFINIINLNPTRENSKQSRKSEKKSSKINHITFENSVTATLQLCPMWQKYFPLACCPV